jgi:uncharacterized protein (TIGR02231 family)
MNFRCTLLLTLLPALVWGQAPVATMPSAIEKAVVYPQGATLTRSGKLQLNPGEYTIVLSPVEQGIDPNSIRVKGKGGGLIRSVYSYTNYLNNTEKSEEIKSLEARLQQLQMGIEDRNLLVQSLQDEENLLLANQKITGTEKGLDVDGMLEMSNLYRTRLPVIRKEKMGYTRANAKDYQEINQIQQQLGSLRSATQLPIQEIHIVVDLPQASTLTLEAEYFIYQAQWSVFHEVYAGEEGKPVELVSKARVAQQTGFDWKGVELVLSTARPTQGGTLPSFQPLWLNQQQPVEIQEVVAASGRRRDNQMESMAPKTLSSDDAVVNMAQAVAQQVEGLTRMDFKLPNRYNLTPGGNGEVVVIKEQKIQAKYRHAAYPRMDAEAFLTAKLYGWEAGGLLPGEASLYVDQAFVGKTVISPKAFGDTLSISLGRDASVQVKHTLLANKESKSFIGKNVKRTRSYRLEVKNTRKGPVKLLLIEQIPVSMNKDIQLEIVQLSGGVHNAQSGQVNWELVLQPGESRVFEVEYTVSHPKDWVVIW